jgi:hypothetical protein
MWRPFSVIGALHVPAAMDRKVGAARFEHSAKNYLRAFASFLLLRVRELLQADAPAP